MSEKEKTQYLETYYYTIRNPAAFTTPEKLYQALKSNKDFKFSKMAEKTGCVYITATDPSTFEDS